MRAGHGRPLDDDTRERLVAFGARLRAARRALGLSSAEIALRLPEEIRVTGASIRAYEKAITRPGDPVVRAVERVLLAEQEQQGMGEQIGEGDLLALLAVPAPVDDLGAWSEDALRDEMTTMRARISALERELDRRRR